MKGNRNLSLVLLMAAVFTTTVKAETKLANEACTLTVSNHGGTITSFILRESQVNPLSWELTLEEMPDNNRKGAPFRGHFLCLGRWGDPTTGEKMSGMPNNGDATALTWSEESTDRFSAILKCKSAPDYMETVREISLDSKAPLYLAKDRVKNTATIGRLFNIVQHATLGTPFLSPSMLINTNADRGFMQDQHLPSPESQSYHWPDGKISEETGDIDLRRSDGEASYVSSHIFTDSIGWVTAISPKHGLLIGYVWKTSDYPWLNVWHQTRHGEPWAKGLEFGTTGLGAPYDELLKMKSDFFGNQSFFFLDALEEFEKKFISFLIEVPDNFENAVSLTVEGDRLLIQGNNNAQVIINSELLKEL